jgi:hypothetical protein
LAASQHAVYKRYRDGHGKRFDTESEARGFQQQTEARMRQNGALRMLQEVEAKWHQLQILKAGLTPVGM